ncbi:MAG: phage tail assembly chaperone [Oscillospiraceae bacterium]|jgi:hypothetical protein|nr:phage tail assembly chaperone [Oscillospiraceae bacterium]
MKVNGSISPPALSFEHRFDGMAEMRFRENITSEKDENGNTIFTYDEYLLVMPDRDGLKKNVQDNIVVWLAYAKAAEIEQLAADVRVQRDKLLADTDWTQADDAPLSSEDKESVRKYRQALRDITAQSGFPQKISWPEKPQVANTENRSDRLDLTAQVTALQAQIAQMQLK